MAESNSYPMLSANNWWNIRKKFKQTIPGTVTASYLSSVLNMQERSATNNIMPYLRQLGIIDAEGKTGERAKLWRDDIDYPKVCDEIRKEIYPQELLDIPCVTEEDRESIKRWFARKTGTGESTVGKISAFYFLLCDKDPSKEPTANKQSNGSKQSLPLLLVYRRNPLSLQFRGIRLRMYRIIRQIVLLILHKSRMSLQLILTYKFIFPRTHRQSRLTRYLKA